MKSTWFIRFFTKTHGGAAVPYSRNVKLIICSLLSAFAAILQSAGLIGGIGYAFSMMATGPIVLATVISIRFGLLSYVVTTVLLMILQPSEVLIFMFTTGLLGVGLGIGFKMFRTNTTVSFVGSGFLTSGILCLLYLFQFPILGPAISSQASGQVITFVVLFSLCYSWIWMLVSKLGLAHLNKFVVRRTNAGKK